MSCNKAFAVLHILIICSATHLKERFERKHTHAIYVTKRFNGEVILLIKEYTLQKRVIGQNGMDKMVHTKWYGQNGERTSPPGQLPPRTTPPRTTTGVSFIELNNYCTISVG